MNTFGNKLKLTLFGESHEKYVGVVIDGLPPGLKIDKKNVERYLSYRRPKPLINTARIEKDDFEIIGGFNEKTDGSTVTILIRNEDTRSSDYEKISHIPRPGHADFPAYIKYKGFNDYRGGGIFSGRMTAPIVAAGGLIGSILNDRGIKALSRVLSIGKIVDENIYEDADLEKRYKNDLRVLSDELYSRMMELILEVRRKGDSIGGKVETKITGVPVGIGEPFFNSIESQISSLAFSIPGIKGIEFGEGFACCSMLGSEFNDQIYVNSEGKIALMTNHNGGINGGLSNGNPIVFRIAVRPTSSIPLEQLSVDLIKIENTKLKIGGRHDPCIVPRVVPIMESISYIVIMDLILENFGGDYFGNI